MAQFDLFDLDPDTGLHEEGLDEEDEQEID
jgi:hypothetical protein